MKKIAFILLAMIALFGCEKSTIEPENTQTFIKWKLNGVEQVGTPKNADVSNTLSVTNIGDSKFGFYLDADNGANTIVIGTTYTKSNLNFSIGFDGVSTTDTIFNVGTYTITKNDGGYIEGNFSGSDAKLRYQNGTTSNITLLLTEGTFRLKK